MTSIPVQQPSGRRFRISPGYWFVLPAVLFFILLAIYPAIYVAFLSFFASGKGINFSSQFSISNYLLAWNSALFGKIISQTFIYAGLATILHLFLGFIIALLLSSLPLNLAFLRVSRTVFLIPWAISPTVIAVISRLLLHPQVGPIGIALRNINPAITYVGPLGDPHQALLAVTLTNVWAFTPFYMLMLLAGMQSIDPGLYEAAIVDGASAWQQIRFVTLPALRNLFLTLGIFDLITTAAYFDLTWIMTQGGPINSTEILPTWIYREAFLSFEFGKAAAIGMILLSVSIFITIFVLRAIEKE